jgi:predicted glutamine amidotransferase
MCLAIVTNENALWFDIENSIKLAWEANPHGAGFAYAKDGLVEIEYGYMTVDALLDRLRVVYPEEHATSQFLIHLRFTSAGETGVENCHPFAVGNYAMIHNGTVGKFVKKGDKKSDTSYMADYLSKLPDGWVDNLGYLELVEDMIGTSRVALLDKFGCAVILNESLWIKEHDVVYSNDYYKGTVRAVQKQIDFKSVNEYCQYCPEYGMNRKALCEMCMEWR